MSQDNPQLKEVMNYIKSTGVDARSAFYMLAKQKGVEPNAFLQQVKSMMNK